MKESETRRTMAILMVDGSQLDCLGGAELCSTFYFFLFIFYWRHDGYELRTHALDTCARMAAL
jgi:hypothetical protein